MEPLLAIGQSQADVYVFEVPRQRKLRLEILLLLVIVLAGVAAGTILLVRQLGAEQPVNAASSTNTKVVTPTPAVSAAPPSTSPPAAPAAGPDYASLNTDVQNWVNSQSQGQWSVVVQDLDNAQNRVAINADHQFYTASLYKLFLLIPLATKLPLSAWSTHQVNTGLSLQPISACVQAMLAKSDNDCGEAVGNYVGWGTASKAAQKAGFNGTSLATSNLNTTAADTAAFMAGLAHNQWFDGPTHDFIMQSLSQQIYRAGIPAGCPNCTVYNKTGQLNGVTHDAAIITEGDQHYVLVAMSQGGSYGQIADLTKLVSSKL